MGKFKNKIDDFLENEAPSRPSWDPGFPDEFFAYISTEEDFLDFIEFISDERNLGNPELVEYGCEETIRFVARIPKLYSDDNVRTYADSKGIQSQLGYLAYVMVLAYGNE